MRPDKAGAGVAACVICDGVRFKTAYSGIHAFGRSWSVLECSGCGLRKTDPFPADEWLKGIYSSALYREAGEGKRFPAPIEWLISWLRSARCSSVERRARKGRALDVGCGRGDFPLMMSGREWQAFGLELDERIEGRWKERGVTLLAGTIEEAAFPDAYFDAVTFWHVFEHIKDPVRTIKECLRVLKPGGLLVIAVPNSSSVQARLSGSKWFHLDAPFHVYHYSARNLCTLLEKSGFRSVAQSHFSIEYNPYGFFQSFLNMLGFRRNLFYDFLRAQDMGGYGRLRMAAGVAAAVILSTVLIPASVLLSIAEAALRRGGTIEVFAVKS